MCRSSQAQSRWWLYSYYEALPPYVHCDLHQREGSLINLSQIPTSPVSLRNVCTAVQRWSWRRQMVTISKMQASSWITTCEKKSKLALLWFPFRILEKSSQRVDNAPLPNNILLQFCFDAAKFPGLLAFYFAKRNGIGISSMCLSSSLPWDEPQMAPAVPWIQALNISW